LSILTYLLDENVSAKTLRRPRNQNFQVTSVKSENLLGTKNGVLLEICKQKEWVLITHDQEFLSPTITNHSGIIVVKIHPAIDSIAGIVLETLLKSITNQQIICIIK